jgi:hypothetical protein
VLNCERQGNHTPVNKFALWVLAASATLLIQSNESRATEFAILRQRFAADPTVEFKVQVNGTAGGLTPGSMQITIPDDDLPADELLTVDFDPVLPDGAPRLGGSSFVFGLTLSDPNTGALISQFADPVTVGFSDQPLPGNLNYGQLSLAYLDQSGPGSPQWVNQDSALEESNSFWCATTNHFTIFALAETADVPEPTGAGLLFVVAALASLGMRHRVPGLVSVR